MDHQINDHLLSVDFVDDDYTLTYHVYVVGGRTAKETASLTAAFRRDILPRYATFSGRLAWTGGTSMLRYFVMDPKVSAYAKPTTNARSALARTVRQVMTKCAG